MNTLPISLRLARDFGGMLLGAVCGCLLTALCHTLSHGTPATVAIVSLAALLGLCGGRITGLLIGALCGAIVAAFVNLVGGSMVGIVLTIAVCALLGTIPQWARRDKTATRAPAPARELSSFRAKELMQWI